MPNFYFVNLGTMQRLRLREKKTKMRTFQVSTLCSIHSLLLALLAHTCTLQNLYLAARGKSGKIDIFSNYQISNVRYLTLKKVEN